MNPIKRPYNEAGGPNHGFCLDLAANNKNDNRPWEPMPNFSMSADAAHGAFLYHGAPAASKNPTVQEREFLSLMYSILGQASETGLDISQLDNEVLQYMNQAGYVPQGYESEESKASQAVVEVYEGLDDLMAMDGFRMRHARTALIHDGMAREEGGVLACPPPLYGARVVDYCCPLPGAVKAIQCPKRLYAGVGRNIMPPEFHQEEAVPYKYDVVVLSRKKDPLEKLSEYAKLGLIDATTLVYVQEGKVWRRSDYLGNPIIKEEMYRKENPTFPEIPDIGDRDVRLRKPEPLVPVETVPTPTQASNDLEVEYGPFGPTVEQVTSVVAGECLESETAAAKELVSLYVSLGTSPDLKLEGWTQLDPGEKICGIQQCEFFHSPSRAGVVDWFVTYNFLRESMFDLHDAQFIFNNQTIWAEIPLGRKALIKVVDGWSYMAVAESSMRYYKSNIRIDVPDVVLRAVVGGDQRFVTAYDLVCHPDFTVDTWMVNRVSMMDKLFNDTMLGAFVRRCRWYARPEMAITLSAKTALYGAHWYAPPFSLDHDRVWMVYMYQIPIGLGTSDKLVPALRRLEERRSRYWLNLGYCAGGTPFAVSKAEMHCVMRLTWENFKSSRWRIDVNHRRLMVLKYYLFLGYGSPQRSNEYRVALGWGQLVDGPKNFPTHFAYEMARRRKWCEYLGVSSPEKHLDDRNDDELDAVGKKMGFMGVDDLRYHQPYEPKTWKGGSRVGGVKPLSDLVVTEDGYYIV